ncbi:hypothetical protein HX99_06520 [Peptococcaceae bacterium SCADC1_2_3]|nr:hypothetical protein HX99_06520 [Peptococcaceae bacterium SCADC1_2_3]
MRSKKLTLVTFFCLLALTLLFALPALAGEPSSVNAPEGYKVIPNTEKISKNGTEALLIQDTAPWGLDADEAVLNEFGIAYDLINSASLAAHNLNGYKFIMYASDQPTSYYQNIAANLAKIEAYVSGGGLLLAHSCDGGWNGGYWGGLNILPGNVAHLDYWDGGQYGSQAIHILDPAHGVVVGDGTFTLTDAYLSGWNWSTHGIFTDLVPEAKPLSPEINQVMVSNEGDGGDGPTYIDYNYGNGKVLATMQTIEWGYAIGCPELLRNEVRFARQWEAEAPEWEYIFEDLRRGTELRINTGDKTFQFIRPGKEFPVKKATQMLVVDSSKQGTLKYDPFTKTWRINTSKLKLDPFLKAQVAMYRFSEKPGVIILIFHQDEELILSAIAIDEKIDFCLTLANDVQAMKAYMLIDKPGVENPPM